MIDEDLEAEVEEHRGAETLLYDYFKHLTSLSLFSLGGVLALAEKVRGSGGFAMLIFVVGLIGMSALLSVSGASEIVRGRFTGRPARHLDLCRVGAPMLLSVGLGGFLYMFIKTMAAV